MNKQSNTGMYKYPLEDCREIRDFRELLNSSEKLFGDQCAILSKDPVALREVAPKSEQALTYKPNSDNPYRGITYSQLAKDVRAFGSYLKKLGIKAKDKVAIIAETRYEWYVAFLAVTNGLAIIVPLDKNLNARELNNNLYRSQANTIIYSKATREKVEDNENELDYVQNFINLDYSPEAEARQIAGQEEVYFWDCLEEGYQIRKKNKSYDKLPIDPDTMSILLFTSGTTAKSKAVMMTQTNVCHVVRGAARMLDVKDKETRYLSLLPLHHSFEGTCGFLIQIYIGSAIAIGDGLRHILKNAQQSKVTMMLMVPAIFESICSLMFRELKQNPAAEHKLNMALKLSRILSKVGIDVRMKLFAKIHQAFGGHLEHIIIGGAAVDPQLMDLFRDFGFTTVQGYGLTETGPILTLNRDKYYDSRSAGLPLPGNEIKIINKGANGIGEITVKSPSVMPGYYQNPELTAKVIDENGYFNTGDYGYVDERGFLYITGRKANIIVGKNGENVFPEEVEAVLQKQDIVKEVLVYGVLDDSGNQVITAEIYPDIDYLKREHEIRDLANPKIEELVNQAVKTSNMALRAHQKVQDFHIRKEPFPKNTTNKILRKYDQKNF